MCQELGDEEMMTAYVEEYGHTSLCSVLNGAGCDERQKEYIEKMKAKSPQDQAAQLARLEAMDGTKMRPELGQWLAKRKGILKQMVPAQLESEEL
mmetsp:Transcript_39215/g.57669  ORF Transcript_39215/g.57669 Transcript_39215/m.57669 type:complete len:95 (-) Transcript_39215:451-735(-)